jgi:tellurite resistance protein TehA-like permease
METARGALGTNVNVTPSLARVTVPATGLPPCGVTVIELLLTVVGSMSSFISATTCVLVGTAVWLLGGLIELTRVVLVSEPEPVTKPLL